MRPTRCASSMSSSVSKRTTARLGIESESEVARLRAQADAEEFNRREGERVRRARVEAETLEKTTAHERAKIEQLAALQKLRIEQELREERMRTEAAQLR